MMILEAVSRKEASLSLSTVSTCAVALLIGRLLLPGDPSSSSSTSWPVREEIQVVGPLEVPSVDAGRAFDRESAAIGQALTLASVAIPSGGGCAEELRTLWGRGVSLTGSKAEIHQVLQPLAQSPRGMDNALLAAAVAVWVLLGAVVALADVREMALQMQDEPSDPACAAELPTSGNGLRRILCRGLCVVAALGLAAAGLTSLSWLRGSYSSIAGSSDMELMKLVAAALGPHFRCSLSDEAAIATLSICILLGIVAARSDFREEADRWRRSQTQAKAPEISSKTTKLSQ